MHKVRAVVGGAVPVWKDLPLKTAGVCLGCVVGPGKDGSEWGRASARFEERARSRNRGGLIAAARTPPRRQ